jgi:hypothetical protein
MDTGEPVDAGRFEGSQATSVKLYWDAHSGPVSNSGREENTPPSSGQPAETTVRAGSAFEVDGSERPQSTSLLQK